MTTLDAEAVTDHANNSWEGIVPVLRDYLAIPNASLDFDPKWREREFMAEAAIHHAEAVVPPPADSGPGSRAGSDHRSS